MRSIDSFTKGHDNNFNLLRFLAATLVLFYHCYPLSLGKDASAPLSSYIPGNSLGYVGVFIFFVISGFLVTKSFFSRKNLLVFAEARFLRIFPALAVSIAFCVLIVGTLFTTVPVREYLTHSQTYRFWVRNSLLYDIQLFLPGVFPHTPYGGVVNGSLWTMPYEIKLYFLVGALGGLTLLGRRRFFNVLYCVYVVIYLFVPREWVIGDVNFRTWAFGFASGMFLYVNRRSIPLDGYTALALWCLPVFLYRTRFYPFAFETALSYGILWFAYRPAGFIRSFNRGGDYSYGIYIYAFPVQQSVAASMGSIKPMQMFPLAFSLTLALAFLSWHFLERPILQSKGTLMLKCIEGFLRRMRQK